MVQQDAQTGRERGVTRRRARCNAERCLSGAKRKISVPALCFPFAGMRRPSPLYPCPLKAAYTAHSPRMVNVPPVCVCAVLGQGLGSGQRCIAPLTLLCLVTKQADGTALVRVTSL